MRLVLAIFALTISLHLIRSQDDESSFVFTSLEGLELLLDIEWELLLNLEDYANALESKVMLIRRAIADMQAENSKSLDDAETYLSNSLNSFALMRRMHTDWIHWELYMESTVGEAEIKVNEELRIDLPSSKDMDQATEAMNRLQITYNLELVKMAAGLLNGKQYNTSLSSRDCFEIGQSLLNQKKIYYSSQWLHAAIERYEENEVNGILGFDKLQIYDAYVETLLKQNLYDTAWEIINEALEYSPNNDKFLYAKTFMEDHANIPKEKPTEFLSNDTELYKHYYRCCRGEFDKRLTRLYCRYNTTTHPFLILAPLKMEELLMDPYIVLFHDVISDIEIAEIKAVSRSNLIQSFVYDKAIEKSVPTKARTGQECTYEDNASDTSKRIKQRLTDLSGFDLDGSPHMTVMNYVLAAHYAPHLDAFNVSKNAKVVRNVGDRKATIVIYLSDVDQGGSTVFPILEMAVHPRKGSALMWYNLNNRGETDIRLYHASCPMLVGSKWIATKWINDRLQTFRRPCFA